MNIDNIKDAFKNDPQALFDELGYPVNNAMSKGGYKRYGKNGSVSINLEKGIITNFESGESGDCIGYVQKLFDYNFIEACKYVSSVYGIGNDNTSYLSKPVKIPCDPSRESKGVFKGFTEKQILDEIESSVEIKNTPAEKYLKSRRCYYDKSENIKYAMLYNSDTKQKEHCLIGIIREYNNYDNILGMQRIYLTKEGVKLNKNCKKLKYIESKKGVYGVIYLTDYIELLDTFGICEGIEDGLTLAKEGYCIGVCINSGNLAKFPYDNLLSELYVYIDNDEAGLKAFESVNNRYYLHGGQVFRVKPPRDNKDFNNYVCEVLI